MLSLSLVGDLKCRNVRLDINNTIIFDSQHEKLNTHSQANTVGVLLFSSLLLVVTNFEYSQYDPGKSLLLSLNRRFALTGIRSL